jgi:hypothetical protein
MKEEALLAAKGIGSTRDERPHIGDQDSLGEI